MNGVVADGASCVPALVDSHILYNCFGNHVLRMAAIKVQRCLTFALVAEATIAGAVVVHRTLGALEYVKILTYLLTPWSRAPLEMLTGSAASQEIPCLFGTRRFLTVPTSARHLSLS